MKRYDRRNNSDSFMLSALSFLTISTLSTATASSDEIKKNNSMIKALESETSKSQASKSDEEPRFKKVSEMGAGNINIADTARFEIKGSGEIKLKGRGRLSVIGKGSIEIDQTSTIKAYNFESVSTVDNTSLVALDCAHVYANSPAKIKAQNCGEVTSTGNVDVTAQQCRAVSIIYPDSVRELKEAKVEAVGCDSVILNGGKIDSKTWMAASPRLIAKNCKIVRIYNSSARAISCEIVELSDSKLEAKDCHKIKNLTPGSNVITIDQRSITRKQ